MLETLKKQVATLLPFTSLYQARQKREFEKKLRAEGYSRKQAMTAAAAQFKNGA